MKKDIKETLDTKGKYRCVRFTTGEVGMVDEQGNPLLIIGPCQNLCFATRGFLKLSNEGKDVFIDMNNGELYAYMPEFVRVGSFELTSIGGYLCARTSKIYEIPAVPLELLDKGRYGHYLLLPYNGEPEDDILSRMTKTQRHYQVSLLKGDNSGVYWFMELYPDDTLLVMDDEGNYYHADIDRKTRRVVMKHLGKVDNEAGKAMMDHRSREIREEIEERKKNNEAAARARTEKMREKKMQEMTSVVPFQIGSKWGLKNDGRILVPAKYRAIRTPVGKYCAVEVYPGIWGVIAIDGKMEIEPRYENVVLHADGTAELIKYGGEVISKKLN